MPRKTGELRVALKVRYRVPGKRFRTRFSMKKEAPTLGVRTMSVTKVGYEQVNNIGEYWKPFRQDNDPESVQLRNLVRV